MQLDLNEAIAEIQKEIARRRAAVAQFTLNEEADAGTNLAKFQRFLGEIAGLEQSIEVLQEYKAKVKKRF